MDYYGDGTTYRGVQSAEPETMTIIGGVRLDKPIFADIVRGSYEEAQKVKDYCLSLEQANAQLIEMNEQQAEKIAGHDRIVTQLGEDYREQSAIWQSRIAGIERELEERIAMLLTYEQKWKKAEEQIETLEKQVIAYELAEGLCDQKDRIAELERQLSEALSANNVCCAEYKDLRRELEERIAMLLTYEQKWQESERQLAEAQKIYEAMQSMCQFRTPDARCTFNSKSERSQTQCAPLIQNCSLKELI